MTVYHCKLSSNESTAKSYGREPVGTRSNLSQDNDMVVRVKFCNITFFSTLR